MQMVERRSADEKLAETLGRLATMAAARGLPLRMRLQPTVLNHETKLYVALPEVSWLFDVAGQDEVLAVKEGLELFFAAMEQIGGPAEMREYMAQVKSAIEAAQG